MSEQGRSENERWTGEQWRRAYWITWSAIGWIALAVAGFWLMQRLWGVVLPLALGLVILVLLRPLADWLDGRGLPRVASVILAYLAFIGAATALVWVLVPVVAQEARDFVTTGPNLISRVQELSQTIQTGYRGLSLPEWAAEGLDQLLAGLVEQLSGLAETVVSRAPAVGEQAFSIVAGVVIGLAIGFYLLLTLPESGPGILASLPPQWRDDAEELGRRLQGVVGGYIRGQGLIAFLVGMLTWAGMALVGVPFPALLGVIAGVGDIVPIVGPVLAGIVGFVIGFLVDPWLGLWAVVVVTAVQQIEGAVLSPKILGQTVGLHPVLVILVVIAATSLLGFPGLLLAVPLLGTAKVFWEYYFEKRGWREAEDRPQDEDAGGTE